MFLNVLVKMNELMSENLSVRLQKAWLSNRLTLCAQAAGVSTDSPSFLSSENALIRHTPTIILGPGSDVSNTLALVSLIF